jgi:hypothetical protein
MAILGDQGPLCDSCFDEQISAVTGWPRLPEAPRPKILVGADGREHQLRYRLWRTPGGISADAIEEVPGGHGEAGYVLRVFGDHDSDPAELLAGLNDLVQDELGRSYLEHDDQFGWQVAGTAAAGRVDVGDDDAPDVVIDGRRLSWTEFGRMLTTFDGWWFRLRFGDDVPVSAPRPDGS